MVRPKPFLSFLYLRAALLLLLFMPAVQAFSQYYNLGQDPGSIRWRQIKSDHFILVYPEDFESRGQHLINTLEYVHGEGTRTLDFKPSRIPVIIHSSDIIPNAFSMWAPKRVELYSCPPQNTYAQNWMEQLAIHEYRHVAQMEMMNHGFTKGLNWIFGEQATAALTGIFVPMWFMEGDAVCAETALSHSGRGRVPNFEMEIRAQVLQKGLHGYDKAVYGSYKDYVPDHYAFGYPLVAYTRAKYGYRSWVKTLYLVARKPFLITPFNRGLKITTGHNKSSLYREAYQYLDSAWKSQASLETYTHLRYITKPPTTGSTRYKYPHFLTDSLIIAERSGMDDISRFVMVDLEGNEKILCTPGFYSTDVFSVSIGTGAAFQHTNKPGTFTTDNISLCQGLLAWTEKETDPRWQNRNYSVIRLFDFNTGKIIKLTRKSRYFAPALAPHGESLVAVKVNSDNTSSLVLLDRNNGKELRTLLTAENDHYITPSWSPDSQKLVFLTLNQFGKSIHIMDIESGNVHTLVPPTFTEISFPVFAGKYVLFNGSYSGIENIYAVDTVNKEIFRVTSSLYGSCNADYTPISGKIVYSEYNSDGYRLAEAFLDPSAWQLLSKINDHSVSLYKSLLPDEKGIVDATTIPDKKYTSVPYRKIAHLFSFHSWAPLFINYPDGGTTAGISAMSQNLLGTAETILGYQWDYAGRTGMTKIGFSWLGWYPVIDFDAGIGTRAVTAKFEDGSKERYAWHQEEVSGGIKLPLLFSKGKNYIGLQLSVHSAFRKITQNTTPDTLSFYRDGMLNSLDYRVLSYCFIKQGIRDVYPRWGQVVDINFRHSPFGNNDYGKLSSVAATWYFPGLVRHHGIKLYTAFQGKSKAQYSFSDRISLPRGYPASLNSQLISLGFNYKFPFLYPDLSLGPIVYIKRLKANIFYDQAFQAYEGEKEQYGSLGAELTSDLHFLRFLFPFDLGIRSGYLLTDEKWFVDFLFSINLSI